jgi:hypothetical protein
LANNKRHLGIAGVVMITIAVMITTIYRLFLTQ